MQEIIQISTHRHDALYDITRQVKESVRKSGVKNGMVLVYVQGATAAIMILFYLMYPLFIFNRRDTGVSQNSHSSMKKLYL
jgi:hypothetical protein